MAEFKLFVIPKDPHLEIDESSAQAAIAYLQEVYPGLEHLSANHTQGIMFYDAAELGDEGGISCPHCWAELDERWWWQALSHDEAANGYQLATISLPCCAAQASLDQLEYDVPQGFARFAIEIYNNEGIDISPEQERRLKEILGCPIRVVYWMM